MKTPVYLDYQATTPIDPRVVEAMMPYLTEKFGNPHSASHAYGWEGEAAVDIAREQVASLLLADPSEIIFNSGASESDNLILKGVMERFEGKKGHMITVATEHSAVLQTAEDATARVGGSVTILPVKSDGLIDLDGLKAAITPETALISVMVVNNEIGVIQPIKEIVEIAHSHDVLVHVDAAQAVGKVEIDVRDWDVDFLSLTAHKFYGPKGIGATYVKRGKGRLILPQISGGSQENGLRAGTLSPFLCVGLGKACALAEAEMFEETKRIAALAKRLWDGLKAEIPHISMNGSTDCRWVGNLNIAFPGLDGAVLVSELRNLAVSSSSACSSNSNKPSRVLLALGMDEKLAQSSLRIGVGRMTTEEEIDFAVSEINATITQLGGLKAL